MGHGRVAANDQLIPDHEPESSLGSRSPVEVDQYLHFGPQDWLDLLRPMDPPEGGRPARLKRVAAMITAVAGIALAIVTFSSGEPVTGFELASEQPTATDTRRTTPASSSSSTMAGEAVSALTTGEDRVLLTLAMIGAAETDLESWNGPPSDHPGELSSMISTTTVPVTATTSRGWSEPDIEPESAWVDAGNGVAVPDVLLRIRFCESTNDYTAAHAVSSARGAYQFLTTSWQWYGHAARYGAPTADQATPAQQDEAAVITLRRDGTRPWLASWSCWGSDRINPAYATARPKARATTSTASTSTSDGRSSTSDSASSTTSTTGPDSTTASTSSTTPSTSSTTTSTLVSTTSSAGSSSSSGSSAPDGSSDG